MTENPTFRQVMGDPLLMDSEEVRSLVRRLPTVEFILAWNKYLITKAGLVPDPTTGRELRTPD